MRWLKSGFTILLLVLLFAPAVTAQDEDFLYTVAEPVAVEVAADRAETARVTMTPWSLKTSTQSLSLIPSDSASLSFIHRG